MRQRKNRTQVKTDTRQKCLVEIIKELAGSCLEQRPCPEGCPDQPTKLSRSKIYITGRELESQEKNHHSNSKIVLKNGERKLR